MIHGIGVGLRREFLHSSENVLKNVDFLEVSMGDSFHDMKELVSPFVNKLPMVCHSLQLSVGSVERPNSKLFEELKYTADYINANWISEHLSFSLNGHISLETFIPLPYTEESIDTVVNNINELKDKTNRDIIIENITQPFQWPVSHYDEAQFISKIVHKADCGILLDVTNLLINATNFSYDPYYYLNNIPRDRIKQLHIAGYKKINDQLFDSHSGGIDEYLIQLTEWILSKTSCKAIVIERDSDYNTFNDLLDDITICRNLLKKYL